MHQINRQLQIGEQIERFQGLSIASHECPRCLNNEEIIADLHNTIALRDAKLKNMELQARHIRVKSSKVEYSDEYVKLSSELDAAVADVAEKQAVIEELLAQATGLVAAKDRERKANLDLRGELEEWQKQALDEGGTPLLRSKAATRRNSTVSGGNPGTR
jgi:predicted  nucleic acid-binding Zn-ribbon protein